MAKAITVENVSKQYRLGQIGTGALTHDINRWWYRVRGKEDPYLKIGETNDRTSKGNSEYVWSLRDINFDIEQGDSVGIIGRNGAGKSTLLKILSRVTAPTTGGVKVKGRIASLLEVGTGFHPELSGRDNIFLNGAILGMRKNEIKRKFDEIVDFAGVERYIDTPVKRYSSGMYVRLAFAVAAHLESEILIVDEVLAVGDMEFQRKCLGKMGEVSKSEGRTILFVSHNIAAIKTLCRKGILLSNGTLKEDSEIANVINHYHSLDEQNFKRVYTGTGIIKKVFFDNQYPLQFNCRAVLRVQFESVVQIEKVVVGITIKDKYDVDIMNVNNRHYVPISLHNDPVMNGEVVISFDKFRILPGEYKLDVYFGDTTYDLEVQYNVIDFEVEPSSITPTEHPINLNMNKLFMEDIKWKFEETY